MKQLVFENYGGHYQPRIEKPDDLEQVLELHEARWVATSAPIFGLNCDPAFLAQLDHNRDGRIRVDEVRHEIRWLFKHLTNRQRLAEKGDVLQLAEIDVGHDSGQKLRAASKRILQNLGRDGFDEISLDQVRGRQSLMANAACNGDGVIPPEAAPDAETADFIRAVMDCLGAEGDASGKQGLSDKQLEAFAKDATAPLLAIALGVC